MNDVLAKPFTRDGMVRILKKQLRNMLRDPPPPGALGDEMVPNGGVIGGPVGPGQAFAGAGPIGMGPMAGAPGLAAGGVVKFEHTPIHSPSTSASWHSPGQMTQTSPNMETGGYLNAMGSGPGGMVLTPGGTQRPQYVGMPQGGSNLARLPDGLVHGDDRPEKRQRLYAPGPGPYVQ